MTYEFFPKKIDILKAAEQAFEWQGNIPVSACARLAGLVLPESLENPLYIECRLSFNIQKIVWLQAQVKTSVNMACYRCGQPMAVDVEDAFHFAILTDASFCERLNEDDDFVLLEEEAQAHGNIDTGNVDLLALIEDEVLLSLPRVIRHESCHQEVAGVLQQTAVPEEKANPFDVLSQFKTGKLS